MTITSFDKSSLATLRASINEALAQVAVKHGLTSLNATGISYSATAATIKLAATTGNPADDNIKRMEAMAFGFKPSVFGAKVVSKTKEFTVQGFSRSRVILLDGMGRSYKMRLDAARPQLAAHALA